MWALWAHALLLMGSLGACGVHELPLPRVGTQVPAQVPLDQLWEIELATPAECHAFGGCPAPYSPRRVEVECSPRERCQASVARNPHTPRSQLTVIGLRPGPVLVNLRYQQPDSDTWLSAKLSLTFLSARPLAQLAPGQHVPAGPAHLERLTDALDAAGIRAPARCAPQNQYRETFVCFGADSTVGEPRYPSCEYTPRCTGGGEPPVGGFFARVASQDGLVTRIETSLALDADHDTTDILQAP